ncbi:MAG TPA: endonuclease domain-containing protein [Candidatus Brocadiales bacterium]|nr:endonuclease domain-containing protein [Candidatus Brocadiales bacterium]
MSSNLTNIAKNLRKRATEAERLLWRYLCGKSLKELKFRRQQPIGRYVVDFVCFDKKVIIEVDGGQHAKHKDMERDRWLQGQGFKVLRFWNNEVLNNLEGVLEKIKEVALSHPPPNPLPSREGEVEG